MQVGAFHASKHSVSRIISSTIRYTPSSLLKKICIPSKRAYCKEHLRVFHSTHTFLFSATPENSEPTKKSKPKKKKFKLGDPSKVDLNALTAAFDEMARRDGFDESTAFYADNDTFEDEFEYDNLDDEQYDGEDLEIDDDDDYIDFGGDEDMSMDERINAARSDLSKGRISVSEDLDKFSREVSSADLQKLGFYREANPFGRDETPRRQTFNIITDAMKCSACGAKFQTKDERKTGYIPEPKFDIQVKLAKIEQAQKLQAKAESEEWTPEDEVEWLLQSSDSMSPDDSADIDIASLAEELGLDLIELSKKKTICKRCHGLQNFGKVSESLRPGWTEEPALSQEKFRNLLLPLREKPAVIIALVDLFDFAGSILPDLDAIAGENPVIIAANKADLLPSKMSQGRAENWVRRELEYLGVQSIANIGGAVRLVSSKTGFGIKQMIFKARSLAEEMECDIYLVGAANAGKSTLIN
jgi:hypothetical protein